ncbi:recombinase family protein [Pseudarthrobacter sp. PS3-L1]|uniref:recombinase family protein n=1 Tax=Pseudarthrobacter sp. PS3-L1 TaxID=3046207 RepID=UPI0024B91D69|nr:recombinase family protein [Pseudarthrobacter sp. PS3-L1]MDJ0321998.1 recombinase family protein [Pseudarthrobacter sp. PS3-L1]
MATLLGYSRVSTTDQSVDLQHDALREAGCFRIWTDFASGATADRPEWQDCLDHLQPGNVLVVNDLSRLGRNTADLANIVKALDERNVGLRSLTETWLDTTTSQGLLMFHFFSAIAEYERNRLRERTMAGLVAAKARGRVGGRPTKMTPDKADVARSMRAKKKTIGDIAKAIDVSEATVVRELARQRKDLQIPPV